MAFIKGYKFDTFISYAHIDNLKLVGQQKGWIEQFYEDLKVLLSRRIGKPDAIKIWWDNKKLDGSILFDQSIEEDIEQSAIIICLTSPGYLASEYCQKELNLFYNKARQETIGLSVKGRSRILNVLLNNIPYTQWPKELSGTTGFPFHDANEDEEDYGDPIEVSDQRFQHRLKDLRDAIVKLINEFPKEAPEEILPDTTREHKIEGPYTIFFAEVSETLNTISKLTRAKLEKKGYRILHGIPPPFEADAHEEAVKKALKKASLSVHLLGQYPGKEIGENEGIWYPQKQIEIGAQSDKPQLIWMDPKIDVDKIEEGQYRVFIQEIKNINQSSKKIEYIDRGEGADLAQQITDWAEQLKLQSSKQGITGKITVLIDTHYKDLEYALELYKSLSENEIQPFINREEDDPQKTLEALYTQISLVKKLVFLYGEVSREWVLERMIAAMQLIIKNNYPVGDFYVFMVPPHKDSTDISLKQRFLKINVVNNSDMPHLDTVALQQFLQNLKAVP